VWSYVSIQPYEFIHRWLSKHKDKFAFTLLPSCSKGHAILHCHWFNAEAICSGKLAWPWRPGWRCWYSDCLCVGRPGNVIPLRTGLSLPAQLCHGAHPASSTMGTKYFSEVKRPGSGANHPPLSSSAEVAKVFDLYILLPAVPG
jgi:hypothetical protein